MYAGFGAAIRIYKIYRLARYSSIAIAQPATSPIQSGCVRNKYTMPTTTKKASMSKPICIRSPVSISCGA